MALGSERLVGRAGELKSLEHALAELGRGRPGVLALLGEPGMGKTRLLAELAARADERRQLVLSGSASELERELPFGLFVDALDDYVLALEPRWLDGLDDVTRGELGHVLPSFPAAAGSLQHERFRTHRAVRRLLEELTVLKPLVLLLDDVHWADSGSLELLGSLLRHPPAAPVLLAVAVRPRQAPERLSGALERAERAGAVARLELGALSAEEARELVGGAAAERLYAESGGNPFYLQQLARSPHAAAQERSAVSLAGVPVPWAVAAALTEELAALSHGERRVLEGAAVVGDPFEPELAATAAGVSEPDAMAALDELLRRDLIQATDVPRRFRFRHPLVRGAVYDAAPGGWRLGAHERSAAALAARGAPAIERAHHVERSARHGDAAAIAVLRQAGEEVVARAPAGAARWFAAALRLLPETAPPEERVALLTARAGAEAATGQFREAHSALLESLELLPGESLPLRFRLTAACAGVEYFLGRHESAHARLAAALDDLPDTASPEAVALMLELARDGSLRGGYDRMRDWAARALTAARALGDRPLMAAAAGFLALGGAFMGSTAEADAARSEGAELLSAMRDEELALRLDAAAGLASAELYLDGFEAASAHAERGLAVARATGQGDALPAFLPILGTIALMRGRLSDAAELMDAAIEAARLSGNDQVLAWNLYTRSFGAAAAGDVETALATAEESVELLGAPQHSLPAAWAGAALAGAVLLAGDPARAEQVLVNAGGGEELALFPGGWRTNFLELLTRCRLALGRHDEAARAAACTVARAEEVGLPMSAAMADRALAAVALNGGDAAKAAERALASAAAADAAGAPVEAAASRELAGRALAQQGELERAGAELRQAAAAFEECVALPRRDAAERELQRLGHRRLHRRTRAGKRDGTGVELLTARELQVARLIVDRKTNPQIASELFLSRKTVETHVRNLFTKLDVSSRVEVARAVERADREAAAR